MPLEADNVTNTYNYPNLLTAICKHAPVFVVKVSRPYFSKSLQGAREKFGVYVLIVDIKNSPGKNSELIMVG